MSKKRRRRGRKEENEERRWCVREFLCDNLTRDVNNLHPAREEGGEIEQEIENICLSLTREGSAPLAMTENFLPS